jgi:hypothetical protein
MKNGFENGNAPLPCNSHRLKVQDLFRILSFLMYFGLSGEIVLRMEKDLDWSERHYLGAIRSTGG